MSDDYPNDSDGDALRRVAGDADMSRPMEIDFFVAVPDQATGEAVGDLATAAGYSVKLGKDEESNDWTAYCSKTMMATYENVVGAQRELDEMVGHLCNCGTDGWGTFGNLDAG